MMRCLIRKGIQNPNAVIVNHLIFLNHEYREPVCASGPVVMNRAEGMS